MHESINYDAVGRTGHPQQLSRCKIWSVSAIFLCAVLLVLMSYRQLQLAFSADISFISLLVLTCNLSHTLHGQKLLIRHSYRLKVDAWCKVVIN